MTGTVTERQSSAISLKSAFSDMPFSREKEGFITGIVKTV
jgi:hypothetical protein